MLAASRSGTAAPISQAPRILRASRVAASRSPLIHSSSHLTATSRPSVGGGSQAPGQAHWPLGSKLDTSDLRGRLSCCVSNVKATTVVVRDTTLRLSSAVWFAGRGSVASCSPGVHTQTQAGRPQASLVSTSSVGTCADDSDVGSGSDTDAQPSRCGGRAGSSKAKMSGSSSNAKIKLLCLHGYMQSAEIFRSRVGSLRKALKSRVEFVFVDAPFEAQGLPDEDPDEVQGGRDGRSWWQWTDTGPAGRPSRAASYTGWEVAQESLLAALKEHEPDAVLGFSQGATATALLLAHLASSQAPQPCKLKCAIMVAGFLPRDSTVAQLVQQGGPLNTVPSLFITGTSDTLVPPDRTKQLFDCFNPSVVSTYTHSGAHFVPTCSGEFKSSLSAFLDAAAAGSLLPPLHRVASTAVVGNANGNASGGGGSGGMSASQSANSLVSADSSTPA